jgi:hypothetical protein
MTTDGDQMTGMMQRWAMWRRERAIARRRRRLIRLYLLDPKADDDAGYSLATCTAGMPAVVGATYAHCGDQRFPHLSGWDEHCSSIGADARFAAREVTA